MVQLLLIGLLLIIYASFVLPPAFFFSLFLRSVFIMTITQEAMNNDGSLPLSLFRLSQFPSKFI